MRAAYFLLGVAFFIVFGSLAYFVPKNDDAMLSRGDENSMKKDQMTLESPAFSDGGTIPSTYTCDGANISPPLQVAGVPDGAISLVLIMDDPDVPKALRPDGVFDHLVAYNIPPSTSAIGEGEVVGSGGLNGRGDTGYTGPCPPPQYEPAEHRYFFRLYALDTALAFKKAPSKEEVLEALSGRVIAEAALMGRYSRK